MKWAENLSQSNSKEKDSDLGVDRLYLEGRKVAEQVEEDVMNVVY